jgi:hypothetical protein
LVDFYRAGGSIHELQKDQSYIEKPKAGGYRSHHFVLRFRGGPNEELFNGRKIELQIRTRLQHAWATAVEAVGMVRNEDLKAGEGNTDWLRLFTLMSSEFAEIEDCPLVPGTYDPKARRQEIRDLDYKLDAAATLERINSAVTVATTIGPANANFFLVQYDGVCHTLRIKGYASPRSGSDQYALDEAKDGALNSVLVDVDKADSLREAYPNYFLDVATFATRIMKITGTGRGLPTGAQELPKVARGYDVSFLRTWKKRPQTQQG